MQKCMLYSYKFEKGKKTERDRMIEGHLVLLQLYPGKSMFQNLSNRTDVEAIQ